MTEHKQKAKADHKKKEARLEVHTTVKKVVRSPDILRQGHGNQLYGSEHQQKAADIFKSEGQQCGCVVIGPIHVGSMIQEFPASFVDRTLFDKFNCLGFDAHRHSALQALETK
jgi:hypothetical protein